jgi:hypothetical protein
MWGRAIAAVIVLVGVVTGAQAQERAPASWSFVLENDKWGDGNDRHFTHGTRITRSSGTTPEWLARAAAPLRCLACTAPRAFELELGQEIYTPENTWSTALVADDRPYAGWAYLRTTLRGERAVVPGRRTAFNTLALEVGVVGPAALAEETQALLHREKGVNVARGWGNQLDNEAGAVLAYTRGLRRQLGGAAGRQEIAPYFSGELGNVRANLGGGLRWRAGRNLASSGLAGAPGWHVFVDVEAQAVVRNVLLDGNSHGTSHSVAKEPLVGSVAAGFEYRGPRFSVSFARHRRGREFVGQHEPDEYGAISFALRP